MTTPDYVAPGISPDRGPEAEAVGRFDRHLAVMGRSPRTRLLYLSALRRWFAAGGRVGHVDRALLARWIASGAHRQRSTQAIDIAALRAFYAFAERLDWCAGGTRNQVRRLRGIHRRVVQWLEPEQAERLLEAPPADTWIGRRDRAVLALLYSCGLRAGELAGLALGDVLEDRMLFVHGKGNRERYTPVGRRAWLAVGEYLRVRDQVRPGKCDALFLARTGARLAGAKSVWLIVGRYAGAALGLGPIGRLRVGTAWRAAVSPHVLRATMATEMVENGCPITAVAEMLGHASIDTTTHYVAGAELAQLREVLLEHHPRGRRHATTGEVEIAGIDAAARIRSHDTSK